MKATTLFYDADCGICTACVDWLVRQAESAGAKLIVIAYQDENEIEKYPVIDRRHADLGIQTLDSDGQLRRDAAALRRLPSRYAALEMAGNLHGLAGAQFRISGRIPARGE